MSSDAGAAHLSEISLSIISQDFYTFCCLGVHQYERDSVHHARYIEQIAEQHYYENTYSMYWGHRKKSNEWWGWQCMRLMPPCPSLCSPAAPCSLHVSKPKTLSVVKVITANIYVNRMDRWLEGSMGKFAWGRSVRGMTSAWDTTFRRKGYSFMRVNSSILQTL